jgi:hypothetical protein
MIALHCPASANTAVYNEDFVRGASPVELCEKVDRGEDEEEEEHDRGRYKRNFKAHNFTYLIGMTT